ncbi:hypothetical protein CISG_02167 [Coccidioides immitis RMSCC 3703]|uniref:Uncharacterized protein n=2 Tax=Coccidioides immitis TaxID=5501 RepID=A0A0J8R666_COCIT|nr:hypothetical protein CIRG_06151 [Coccidioides immitis RMSCC 2394]KMU80316.1 hypothetical protein CISG_02167 [Coccidioides immitis RMSCC 3703]
MIANINVELTARKGLIPSRRRSSQAARRRKICLLHGLVKGEYILQLLSGVDQREFPGVYGGEKAAADGRPGRKPVDRILATSSSVQVLRLEEGDCCYTGKTRKR